jgi:myo-inositol-1-phosphate synthase
MAIPFTRQGCDSVLVAPLEFELARLADVERGRGGRGLMKHLACFFKSPEGVDENDFFKQINLLAAHAKATHAPADGAAAVHTEPPGRALSTD